MACKIYMSYCQTWFARVCVCTSMYTTLRYL